MFPIVLVGREFWTPLLDWVKATLLDRRMISPEDLELLVCTDDPSEVERIVVECYRQNCADVTRRSVARR